MLNQEKKFQKTRVDWRRSGTLQVCIADLNEKGMENVDV
jgi:hypothetical protein